MRWLQHNLNGVLGLRLAVNGIMSSATRSAIRTFQQREGLPVDGIAGPPTQAALIRATSRRSHPAAAALPPRAGGRTSAQRGRELDATFRFETLQFEFAPPGEITTVNRRSRDYVAWVQRSLNQLAAAGLTVDGLPGPRTRAAVQAFQQRAGLAVDGTVGPQTERALTAAGASAPPRSAVAPGRMGPYPRVNTLLPIPGQGYFAYHPSRRWGQYGLPQTIRAIQAIGAAWQRDNPGAPRIGIGDISRQGGGSFLPPHKSHDKGLDVDIRPMRKNGQEGRVIVGDPTYSQSLTRRLVDAIRNNGVLRVKFIFFNDPVFYNNRKVTGVSYQKGHHDHLHVRFFPPGS